MSEPAPFPMILAGALRGHDGVFIQPHNYPDHDAIASAFGLQELRPAPSP